MRAGSGHVVSDVKDGSRVPDWEQRHMRTRFQGIILLLLTLVIPLAAACSAEVLPFDPGDAGPGHDGTPSASSIPICGAAATETLVVDAGTTIQELTDT